MKKLFIAIICLLSLGMAQAQTVSKATVEQYRQLQKLNQQSFSTCSDQLTKWGFVHNEKGVINMFTMLLHPFYRAEGQDTVAALLGVINDVVYSTSGVFSSMDAERTYAMIAQAGEIQQQLASEMGLIKYVCSIKGKVSNKHPKNREELVAVLTEGSAETVKWVYESWKSDDGKVTLTLMYDNKLFEKKKPRKSDRVELTLGLGTVPE